MNEVVRNGKTLGLLKTVIPLRMHLYCRALAFVQNLSLRALYKDCAESFLDAAPWKEGLLWRDSPRAEDVDEWDWISVGVALPREMAERILQVASECSVPVASVLCTMFFWYSWVLYPPLHEQIRGREVRKS